MGEMLEKSTPQQVTRVKQAFLPMKKFDLAALKKAYGGDRPAKAARTRRAASRLTR
jgi:hypothetical protein